MSEDAKKTIETIKSGKLPPLNTSNSQGTQLSQRGIDHSTYGLQTLNEDLHSSSNKSNDN